MRKLKSDQVGPIEGPGRPITDALRGAIREHISAGGSLYQLACATDRLLLNRFSRFATGQSGLLLGTAECLAAKLGLRIAPESAGDDDALPCNLVDGLRHAMRRSGLDHDQLRRATGLRKISIISFLNQDGILHLRSADRLAAVLGLTLMPGRPEAGAPDPRPTRDPASRDDLNREFRSAIKALNLSTREIATRSAISITTERDL